MIRAEDFYLTEEDYLIAEANGIPRNTLYTRVYYQSWDKKKAMTKVPRNTSKEYKKWQKKAEANGVCKSTFSDRVTRGWPMKKAAITPVMSRSEAVKVAQDSKRLFTEEQIAIAKANGISAATVRARVTKLFWSVERAITQPVNKQYVGKNPGRKRKVEE